jgi:hypothetical protein
VGWFQGLGLGLVGKVLCGGVRYVYRVLYSRDTITELIDRDEMLVESLRSPVCSHFTHTAMPFSAKAV